MGIINWHGVTAYTGEPWQGVSYFTTLRLPVDPEKPLAGRSRDASVLDGDEFASFNLGTHVGDDPQAVLANRRGLEQTLPQAPTWLEQVHGVEVFDADASGNSATPPVADAVITGEPYRVLSILTADCLPVVLSDFRSAVLGVAHAGWRGLAGGVLENTLAALQARAPAGSRWRAWIGPAIGPAAFEVGPEVRAAFVDGDGQTARFFMRGAKADKWQADLAGLAAHRLSQAGVEHVQADSPCTYERADWFYSYRRDGKTGRMATLAWLHGSDLP
ncbi:MAG TPA: peptidoglycan editing factor PgeF [Pusillimonas sp.]|uniref:peptidoglycan editing factor PgeF n=1 Tax=Pusillimonas sp. TaxID=3040095 RepID=UPI002C3A9F45|nr:peptidoglycan editing factor PgeF [Pusillimonas sp.]HUH88367.1 peptidoglycan editing factor PgeF [Pusillimonas sp.]